MEDRFSLLVVTLVLILNTSRIILNVGNTFLWVIHRMLNEQWRSYTKTKL